MLCFANPQTTEFGDICTNRCPDRHNCYILKTSFLIEAADLLASEINSEDTNGLFLTSFVPYCSAPEAYINGAVYDYQPTVEN